MGYASKFGRARISSRNPQALAICDRCGFGYNHVDLRWQFDWRGSTMQNTRMLVCSHCEDQAQQQLRAIVLPADPTPIQNARPPSYYRSTGNFRATDYNNPPDARIGIPVPGGDQPTLRTTQTNDRRVTQQTGNPSTPDSTNPPDSPPETGRST